jgi:predicted transcriptional regulator
MCHKRTVIVKTETKCKHCGGDGVHWVVNPESLKKTRIAAGISLRAFAKQLGFTPPYISDIENGRRACTFIIESAYSALKLKKSK